MSTEEIDVNKLWEDSMIALALHFPTLAQLIARMGTRIVRREYDSACAWTYGKSIFINEVMINYLNDNECKITKGIFEFLLCHELMHIISFSWDRGKRMGVSFTEVGSEADMKRDLWNQATDYEINSLLYYNNPQIGTKPPFGLFDVKYKDMTAEEIYKQLLKEEQENPNSHYKPDVEEQLESMINDLLSGKSDSKLTPDMLRKVLDRHTPIESDSTKTEIIEIMSQVFGSTTNSINTGVDAFDRIMKSAFKEQPFNWKKALTKYIRGYIKGNYTWNRRSRSGMATGLILPSSYLAPKMKIAVAVDTSGSISHEELDTMLNHVFTILNQFNEFEVDVWCCGSVVYEETLRTYTSRNKNTLVDFPLKSDGGNDMKVNFDFIREHYKGKMPDVFICFSDFYDGLNGDTETTSPCPVIWLVVDHDDFVPPTLIKAETFHYQTEKGKGAQ